MTDPDLRAQRVRCVHESRHALALCLAGGAHRLADWLFAVPGASRAMVSACIPYTPLEMNRYLGHAIASAVSSATAEALALRARQEAARNATEREPLGFACTAALATSRERKGPEHAHLCVAGESRMIRLHVQFDKGRWSRDEEEDLLAEISLGLLADFCETGAWSAGQVGTGFVIERQDLACGDALARLCGGTGRWVTVEPDGRQSVEAPPAAGALLPGSFNPLHQGHAGIARAAARRLGMSVDIELSIENADKQALDLSEVRRRLDAMGGRFRVQVTRAATFLEKARLFPGVTWVVGYDTATRLVLPKYYGGEERRDEAFRELARLRAGFLVVGRTEQGLFRTLDQVSLPSAARGLFRSLPEADFRLDMSSTEIRSRAFKTPPGQAPGA